MHSTSMCFALSWPAKDPCFGCNGKRGLGEEEGVSMREGEGEGEGEMKEQGQEEWRGQGKEERQRTCRGRWRGGTAAEWSVHRKSERGG